MTFKEAVQQADRELGLSDDEIQKRTDFANRLTPIGAELVKEAQIKPGMERECIEELKRLSLKMKANPQAALLAFEKAKAKSESFQRKIIIDQ